MDIPSDHPALFAFVDEDCGQCADMVELLEELEEANRAIGLKVVSSDTGSCVVSNRVPRSGDRPDASRSLPPQRAAPMRHDVSQPLLRGTDQSSRIAVVSGTLPPTDHAEELQREDRC